MKRNKGYRVDHKGECYRVKAGFGSEVMVREKFRGSGMLFPRL